MRFETKGLTDWQTKQNLFTLKGITWGCK